MTMTTERKEYTPQSLAHIIDNKVQCRTVGEMYNLLIAEMKKSGRLGNLAVYKYSRDSLLKFTRNRLDIPFTDIDTNWLKRYENWLDSRECKDTTKSQLFRTLRSVFNKAIEQGIIKQDCYPFNRYKLAKFDLKTQKRAISKEDMQKIIALNLFGQSDYLELARDMFLFSYFSAGINFTDIALITIADISEGRVQYIRKKTGKAISAPLCDITNGIISKYITESHSNTDYIFPILNRNVHKTEFRVNNFRELTVKGEREGRFDLVIYKNNTPIIVYEVKTYFKDNERFSISTAEVEIEEDLKKLAKRVNYATGYFLMACKKETFERDKEDCSLNFVTELKNSETKYIVSAISENVTVIVKRREVNENFLILSFAIEKL